MLRVFVKALTFNSEAFEITEQGALGVDTQIFPG